MEDLTSPEILILPTICTPRQSAICGSIPDLPTMKYVDVISQCFVVNPDPRWEVCRLWWLI